MSDKWSTAPMCRCAAAGQKRGDDGEAALKTSSSRAKSISASRKAVKKPERDWISLNEAFYLVTATPVIWFRAKERGLRRFFEAIYLETEKAMSGAGLTGGLQFRGLRSKYAKAPVLVPPEWFGAKTGRRVEPPRGIDPDSDEILFAPLHQQQDIGFAMAAELFAQEAIAPRQWLKVQVKISTLDTFLKLLDGEMPATRPLKRRPSAVAIDAAIYTVSDANAGAAVTEAAVIQQLRSQGYEPTREPVRVAIENSGLRRKAGRPSG